MSTFTQVFFVINTMVLILMFSITTGRGPAFITAKLVFFALASVSMVLTLTGLGIITASI